MKGRACRSERRPRVKRDASCEFCGFLDGATLARRVHLLFGVGDDRKRDENMNTTTTKDEILSDCKEIILTGIAGIVVKIDNRTRGTVYDASGKLVAVFGGPYTPAEVTAKHGNDWASQLGADHVAACTRDDHAEMRRTWRMIGQMW